MVLKNHEEDLGKSKLIMKSTPTDKKKHYSNALDWFKLQTINVP
jgi:hypothetical protein